jgi:hypothetical protein
MPITQTILRINLQRSPTANGTSDPAEQAMLNALRGRMMLATGDRASRAALLPRAVFFESQQQLCGLPIGIYALSDAAPEQQKPMSCRPYPGA